MANWMRHSPCWKRPAKNKPLPVVCAVGLETIRLNSDQPTTEQKKKLEQWVLDAIADAKDSVESPCD